jgi:hypothetical protein
MGRSGLSRTPSYRLYVLASWNLTDRRNSMAVGQRSVTAPAQGVGSNIPGDGVFEIGTEIKYGKYHTTGPNGDNPVGCYYSFNKPSGDIVDNNIVNGPATITIDRSRAGLSFETSSCGEWKKVG